MKSILRNILLLGCTEAVALGCITSAQEPIDKKIVANAYAYLLGRALVIRQKHTDLKEPGIGYNVIKYNPVGSADSVNPNLDVAYLEAWIAVDGRTPVVLEVPEVKNRYYTAQILDEWGEVITNINERNYPSHPYGKFAFVDPGSHAIVPDDAVRIELHSHKAKLLGRVELRDDSTGAVTLQHKFKLTPLGNPAIEPAAPLPAFGNRELIGVELFDSASRIIESASDVSPVAAQMQAKVQDISRAAENLDQRKVLDELIKNRVIPEFLKYAAMKSFVLKDHWLGSLGTGNYASNYLMRTSVNLLGLWSNTNDEVIYFVSTQDSNGEPLSGANEYVLEFSSKNRPEAIVEAFWSMILVDLPDYRVVPNPLSRFNLNNYSGLKSEPDGSLKILISSKPNASVPESNWLPAPDGKPFSLTIRTYVPKDIVKRGEWFPPALRKIQP
jgi:hypothetical protein